MGSLRILYPWRYRAASNSSAAGRVDERVNTLRTRRVAQICLLGVFLSCCLSPLWFTLAPEVDYREVGGVYRILVEPDAASLNGLAAVTEIQQTLGLEDGTTIPLDLRRPNELGALETRLQQEIAAGTFDTSRLFRDTIKTAEDHVDQQIWLRYEGVLPDDPMLFGEDATITLRGTFLYPVAVTEDGYEVRAGTFEEVREVLLVETEPLWDGGDRVAVACLVAFALCLIVFFLAGREKQHTRNDAG